MAASTPHDTLSRLRLLIGRFLLEPLRGNVVVLAAFVILCASFSGFVQLNHLADGALRWYGGYHTTDELSPKETQFFIAFVLLGGAATVCLAILVTRLFGEPLARFARARAARPRQTVLYLAAFALVATALVSWLALQHAPILNDEQQYLFQAELLRSGRMSTTLPEPLGPFRDAYSVQARGMWTGIYPWGHVAFLMPGVLVGFPQLVPHLCAAAAVLLAFWLGRELYPDDGATPLVAALVVATSPFIAFTCGTIHNSTSSMILVTTALAALTRAVRASSLGAAALAGLCFSLGLSSRPYNAVAVAIPSGALALALAWHLRRRPIRLALAFFVGLLPGVVLFLGTNYLVTGDPLVTPAHISMPEGLKIVGFGDGIPVGVLHTPLVAFGQAGTNLVRLLLWSTGSLVASLGLLGLLIGLRRSAADLMLLVPLAGLFGFYYFFYTSPATDTGPLYYLDLVPVLALIFARVASAAVLAMEDRARAFRRLCGAWLAALAVAFASWWPLQGIAAHRVTDNTLLPFRAVEAAGIHDAIVWFNSNRQLDSWTLPAPPPHPDLSDDVLFARFKDSWAIAMWRKYHDTRSFYRLNTGAVPPRVEPWEPQSDRKLEIRPPLAPAPKLPMPPPPSIEP